MVKFDQSSDMSRSKLDRPCGGLAEPSGVQRGMTAEKYIEFACPHCGQQGEVIWNDNGKDRAMEHLSNGFHVEEGRLPGARHVIICDICDEIDPPKVLVSPLERTISE
jgi:hypothetical protein